MVKLDPWGTSTIEDYSHLFEEFGIQPFKALVEKIPNPHRLMRRGIIFGHRNYEAILDALLSNSPFAVMSGFMPSGKAHFGSKMVMEEIIWHQEMGGDAYVAIADIEAHVVRGLSWDRCAELGRDYILSIIALGLKPEATIYFQSTMERVKDLAIELSGEVNLSELVSIYGFGGDVSLAHMHTPIIQSADILNPQLDSPKPVVVPVGPDQDPHIRLTRELADRVNMFKVFEADNGKVKVYPKVSKQEVGVVLNHLKTELEKEFEVSEYEAHLEIAGSVERVRDVATKVELEHGGFAFLPPSSTYHRFMEGLTGGKMSSSKPESYIALTDDVDEAVSKLMRAKTGGRISREEQIKLGGNPEECSVYAMLLFHLVEDDEELTRIYMECRNGERLCGQCKSEASSHLRNFLIDHQQKREEAVEKLDEYNIVWGKRK
jgi:tryptophanyl-tRNA synthetase